MRRKVFHENSRSHSRTLIDRVGAYGEITSRVALALFFHSGGIELGLPAFPVSMFGRIVHLF
jgi:hypothetical protein